MQRWGLRGGEARAGPCKGHLGRASSPSTTRHIPPTPAEAERVQRPPTRADGRLLHSLNTGRRARERHAQLVCCWSI